MQNVASDLLLLTTNLSQIKMKARMVNLFVESLNNIFKGHTFEWSDEIISDNPNSMSVCTISNRYGSILYNMSLGSHKEHFALFQNATQLLAILIERLEQENLLNNQKEYLQVLVNEQTNHLITAHDELNEANEEFATINEELMESNKSLIELNDQLNTEIKRRSEAEHNALLSEEKFKNIFEHAAIGKSITSTDGILMVNQAFCDILGYPKEELNNLRWQEITHPDDIEYNSNTINKILKKEINSANWQKRYIHKNGSIVWTDITTAVQRDSNDNPLYFITTINDITSRKQTEEKLRLSEQRLQTIMDFTQTAIWDWDLVNDIWYTSPLYYTMLGYEPITGSSDRNIWLTRIHPDDRASVESKINAVLHEFKVDYSYEARMKHADGSYRWHNVKGYVVDRDEKGKAIRLIGIRNDITERKNTEAKILENEVQYKNLANSGMALIWTAGTDKNCNYFNEPWMRFTGRTLEQELGNGWTEGVHPDDFNQCLQTYVTAFDNREVFEMEYRLKHHTGEYRWIQDLGNPNYSSTGEFIGYIGQCFDITERKQIENDLRHSNELLSLFIHYSPIFAFIKEVSKNESKVIKASENFIDMIGITGSEMNGKTMHELFPLEFAEKITADDWKVVSDGISLKLEEELNGKYYTTYKFPIKQENRNLLAGYTVDITERKNSEIMVREKNQELKRTNQDLLIAKEKAEESDRLKSAFLANMSHEIRTPMNSIMGFASLLMEEDSKVLTSKYSNIILNSSEQLLHIIDAIVLYSKLQTKLLINTPRTFDAFDLLLDIKQSFDLPAYKNKAELIVDSPEVNKLQLNYDYEKLRQICTNLISNAFKYTPQGTITFGCKYENDHVLFFIKDNGIGIPKAEQEKIFERFFRASNVNKTVISGTGLGLSIVRELVELLGGKIWVESEEGIGSKFQFTLPMNQT